MNQEKPKNYYSLNLTEGRIFIIFVSIILLVVIIIFGCVIIISNNQKKANQIDFTITDEESPKTESDNFTFYSDLTGESEIIILDNNPEVNNTENISLQSKNIDNQNDFKIEFQEKVDKQEIKNKHEDIDNKDIVKIDNSEVLYSSNYNKNPKTLKTDYNKNKQSYTKTQTSIKQKTSTTNKRYIVQIGSYENKQTVNDISYFYQKQGYPTYIKTKESNDKTFYRLRVGPFKQKERAETYLTSLKNSKYGKSSYISVVYL
ncbi:MAG: SPOR domain-containing protein [Spirochaetes bacterium]|nr:SPOR domain-containing protein [Spirochaetota bacterium]